MLEPGGQLNRRDTGSRVETHKEILSTINFQFFGNYDDLAVIFKDGKYILTADYREYTLPIASFESHRLLLNCVPNINETTLSLLTAILSLHFWQL